jgi:NAD(P)-dependent dehydrogenase (short-subunit alcohol dehydrogenase family)
VLPYLRKQGGGNILITSSIAGIIIFPTAGIYNATKWAVEGLGETLAPEGCGRIAQTGQSHGSHRGQPASRRPAVASAEIIPG